MDMKERILDVALALVQQRGVNAFSYADIAKEVGVSKASVHHHFATKSELVNCLMENYTEQLIQYLDSHNQKNLSAKDKLNYYCDVYRNTLDNEKVCLGGMLSAEALTLGSETKPLLSRFFEYQKQWLIQVLKQGEESGELHLNTSGEKLAVMLIATLQGALVVSRSAKTPIFFDQSVEGFFSFIE